MEKKDTCFCEESFIVRSFLAFEILGLGGRQFLSPLPWLHKSKKSMVNRVKTFKQLSEISWNAIDWLQNSIKTWKLSIAFCLQLVAMMLKIMLMLIIYFYYQLAKLDVPVVTLSARHNQKLSKLLSRGFERSVYWNEYKTKIKNKNTTNEYRYFLKWIFFGVNRLFF